MIYRLKLNGLLGLDGGCADLSLGANNGFLLISFCLGG